MGTIPLLFGPMELWLETVAAVAEPDPDIDLMGVGTWFKLGEHQNLGYSSDGVRLEESESLTDIFTDGVTMAVDSRRTEESKMLSATLMEDSLDLSSIVMAYNNNEVTQVMASPSLQGSSTIDLYKGPHVAKFQLVGRAMSDPDQGVQFPVQLWIPIVRLGGSISSAFVKGDPLMVEASFMALYHPTLRAGTLKKITADTT